MEVGTYKPGCKSIVGLASNSSIAVDTKRTLKQKNDIFDYIDFFYTPGKQRKLEALKPNSTVEMGRI
ncbi:MAG: hypothetical protein VX275_01230, partial [Pseudomonadota bacterium]|nr:hypothetical protein [Pseudomonadota bacterium]